MKNYIEYNKIKYEIKEPTIKMWADVMKFKNILEPHELNLKMLEYVTGLTHKEIMEGDALSVAKVGEQLMKYLNKESKELFQTFEFEGQKYQFMDINKMTFGQFVDIDTFLSKDEGYKNANLNELAAYMFVEVIDGKPILYGDSNFKERIDKFKELPLKYVEGAVFFLVNLGYLSLQLTQIYSENPFLWWTTKIIAKIKTILTNIGGGIKPSVTLPKTGFGWFLMLLLSPLFLVSTILHTLWTTIKKAKKRTNK